MTAWMQVLVAMAEGPTAPLRGTVRTCGREVRSSPMGWASVGKRPLLASLPGGEARVWRAPGGQVRVETTSGQLVHLCDGRSAWRFEDGKDPVRAPAEQVRYLGPGSELLYTRPPAEWLGCDFTRPTGPVRDIEFLDRPAWEVELAPPPHKPHPVQLVVDAATGAVLALRNDAAGLAASYTDLHVGGPASVDLFTWEGPHRTAQDEQREHRSHWEALQRDRLDWFHSHVSSAPLTVSVLMDLGVTTVHTLDRETGAFEASLARGALTGSLARRPRSEQPWGLRWGATTHRWSTPTHEWALSLHEVQLDQGALAALRQLLHPGQETTATAVE